MDPLFDYILLLLFCKFGQFYFRRQQKDMFSILFVQSTTIHHKIVSKHFLNETIWNFETSYSLIKLVIYTISDSSTLLFHIFWQHQITRLQCEIYLHLLNGTIWLRNRYSSNKTITFYTFTIEFMSHRVKNEWYVN